MVGNFISAETYGEFFGNDSRMLEGLVNQTVTFDKRLICGLS